MKERSGQLRCFNLLVYQNRIKVILLGTFLYAYPKYSVCVLPEAAAGQCQQSDQGQQHSEGQQSEHVQKHIQTQEKPEDHQLQRKRERNQS